jgi:NADPH:quinone reductase-like Zn-dependent oxidoreductase
MKALVATGRPQSPVVVDEVEEPKPGPGEALVEVTAFSVNRGETFQLERPRPGWRPGKDVAGVVVRAARDGSGPAVGTRVVGHPPQGGWAQFAAVPASSLAALPDTVAATTAAALPLAGLTALRLIRTAGPLIGRRVLLTGASGGVGHYFVELAAAAGAGITAVTGSAERGRRLLELGARQLVHEVADAQGPFDLVLESTGGKNLPTALARLAPRGTLVWFGQASRTPVTLDFFDFFDGPESAVLRHFHYEHFDTPFGEDLATLVDLVDQGRLHPEIGVQADWAETADVLERLRERRVRGNAVLTIGRPAAS